MGNVRDIGPQKPVNINIDLKDCEKVSCINCKGETFTTKFTLRKVSAVLSPTGNEIIIPVEVFVCDDCNTETGIFNQRR